MAASRSTSTKSQRDRMRTALRKLKEVGVSYTDYSVLVGREREWAAHALKGEVRLSVSDAEQAERCAGAITTRDAADRLLKLAYERGYEVKFIPSGECSRMLLEMHGRGLTWKTIAGLAEMPVSNVYNILRNGSNGRVAVKTHEAICAAHERWEMR